VFVGESALKISDVRRLYGTVGGKLDRSARNERSCRHNYLIVVTGHIPRFGSNITVYRRAFLYTLTKRDKVLGVLHKHRCDDVPPLVFLFGVALKAKQSHYFSRESGGF